VGRKDTARVQNEHVEVTVRDKSGVVATRLVPLAGSARLTAAQKAAAARVWMSPRVTAVRGRVAEEYVPRVADAVSAAIVASGPVRKEAMARGNLALAALKGEHLEVVQPKRRRGRKVVGFLGLAGIAAAVVAWWRSQQQPVAPWEDTSSASSSSSAPSPSSTVYPATGGTGATGASSADTTATGSRLDSSTDTSEPPGPVLATSASPSEDLTTPSTAMGTTSESTSPDPAGESTSHSPSPDDVSTMDSAADAAEDTAEDSAAERATDTAGVITSDTPRKSTRSRASRSDESSL
jgi:hypothetical protein